MSLRKPVSQWKPNLPEETNTMWADTHCHLDTLNEQEISRAVSTGVTRFAIAGLTGCSREAKTLAERHEEVFLMTGIHPLFIDKTEQDVSNRLHNIAIPHPKCIAIGEIGLDYSEKDVDRERQKIVFSTQLRLAAKLKLPVSIHLRRAFPDFLEIIKHFSELTVVMHMYSGSAEFARQLQQTVPNVFFSFGGPAIRPNAQKAHAVLHNLPPEKILVETDSPDLPPPGSASPNIPANLPKIGGALADLLDMTTAEFEALTWNNAREVFKW